MVGPFSALVAVVMLALFYTSFDSGLARSEPAPPGITGALFVFTVIFGCGAWAMNVTGNTRRAQMFAGVGCATGLYGLGRLLFG
jgi:hypothetical protein